MRLIRAFVGDLVVFPIDRAVAEGVLRAVERSGYMMVVDCKIEGKPAGDLIIPVPAWVRRVTDG